VIVVIPTRAMGVDDADYAVSFAVPVDTPGLSLYVSPQLPGTPRQVRPALSASACPPPHRGDGGRPGDG